MVAMVLLFMLLLLSGVSAPVESGADATAARTSGASRRALPQGMCEPACKRCAAKRTVGGPHGESILTKGGRAANGSSSGFTPGMWDSRFTCRHVLQRGRTASATRDCITRWRDAARAHVTG